MLLHPACSFPHNVDFNFFIKISAILISLQDFTDQELAFFYKYRFAQYTPETQEEIANFIFEKRQIFLDKIETLLKTPKTKNAFCKRCGSDKILNYDVVYDNPASKKLSYYQWEDLKANFSKKNQIECFVCGNIIENPNETYFDKILKFIKGN
ncbi:hypothetical protein [Soonwooa sp.]|uniref:hypothetical protein n=1 Tax=Soonwooa sp. TaxID=1938592 RepID=UPI0035B3B7B9